MTVLTHTWHLTGRHLRAVARQPTYVAISLVQPMVYLLLFGALFQQVAAIPGFGPDDYLSFLTPGIVIMGALFGGGWIGLGVIEDLDRGADLAGGVPGLLALLASAVLLAAPFGALSFALAVTLRQQESVVGLVQFTLMPLTFTATAFMPRELMPGWIQSASRSNPVDWAVTAAREAMTVTPQWGSVLGRHAALLMFTVLTALVAITALRRYQRTS